jgi:hypothetical protein
MAAWAAGGIWLQSSAGIGGTSGTLTFYGRYKPGQVRAVNAYPERDGPGPCQDGVRQHPSSR